MLLTLYCVTCDRFEQTANGAVQKKCFTAHWSHPNPDSPQARKEVLASIAREIGVDPKILNKVEFRVEGYVPERLVSDNRVSVSKALPSARARCVIEFSIDSPTDISRLQTIECQLEQALEKADVGFVDGNDIEPELYRIFCLGPQKAPLRSAIEAELAQLDVQAKCIR